jgi:hypothetical protein
MSTNRFRILTLAAVFAALLMLAGCYTQFGSLRTPREDGSSSEYTQAEEPLADSVSDEEYTNARQRFYDESYYPTSVSIGFDYAWGSPWYSRSPWGWYGSSWYGSPWYYDPLYGFNGGYVAYHGYYGGPYYGGGSAVGAPRYPGATRRIGPNRTYGTTRGTVDYGRTAPVYTPLPTGVRSDKSPATGGAAKPPAGSTPVSTGRRGVSGERRAPAREPAKPAPAPDSGTRSSGSSRGSERPAYTPPPAPPSPPPQSQPAPSGGTRGGETRSGGESGGSRGGGRR